MNAQTSFLRHAGLLAGVTLALTASLARGADKVPSDAFPVFDSYIKITGQSASVTGNDTAYARRFQTPSDGAFGIEDLRFSKDLNKETSMEVEGRALSGKEDYLGRIKLTKTEVGSVEVGYKSFRTFYQKLGGFFPVNSYWNPLGNNELHTDRAKFWTTAKINLPNAPVFELSYVNDQRTGRKDTTIWGDTDFTGIPIYSQGALNLYTATKRIVPAYLDLNERQETLTGLMTHTVGNTTFDVEISNNKNKSGDTRWVNRYPGELKPFPAIPANPLTVIAPALGNNPNFGFDKQITDSTIWTYTGKFETKINEMFTVFGGVSYQDATADIGGNRQIAATLPTLLGPVTGIGGFAAYGRPPYSYTTTSGNTSQTTFTGNIGTTFVPQPDLRFTLALKGETVDMNGTNQVIYYNTLINQTTGTSTPVNFAAPNTASRSEKSWVPELDVRYTGIHDVALYGTFDYRYSPGTDIGSSTGVNIGGGTVIPSVVASTDNTQLNHGHYKVGANWTVSPMLSLRGEYFYKDHKNEYAGYGASTGSNFILGYQFHGTKLTALVKLSPELSFTTRYMYQTGKMDTVTNYGTSYDSMDSKNHTIGETIDWTPTSQVYVQLNVNVVLNTIATAYPRAGGTANNVLRNADNNYLNGSLITGFVVDKNTDANVTYTYYHADNYDPTAPVAAVSYGAGIEENVISVNLKHKFTDRLLGEAKVGYFDSKNDTTGGFTNYHGPMGYVSLTCAL